MSASPRIGWMVLVWALSITLSAVFFWISLENSPDRITVPSNFDTLVSGNDLLIGSSLSWAALPAGNRFDNVLDPNRLTVVASLDSISESHSIQLLQAAADAGAHTVLLEVNALAHEYDGMRYNPLAATFASILSEFGKKMTLVARNAIGLPAADYGQVRLERLAANRQEFLLAGPVVPRLFPRKIWDSSGFERVLAACVRQQTRVLLFWPPVPEGGFGRDPVRYDQIRRHIIGLANLYTLPLWISPVPWPDEFFLDNFGHLNEKGSERFAREIAYWARSL